MNSDVSCLVVHPQRHALSLSAAGYDVDASVPSELRVDHEEAHGLTGVKYHGGAVTRKKKHGLFSSHFFYLYLKVQLEIKD